MLHKICTENEETTAEHVVVDPYDLVWQQVSRQTGRRQCVGGNAYRYPGTGVQLYRYPGRLDGREGALYLHTYPGYNCTSILVPGTRVGEFDGYRDTWVLG